MRQPNGMCKYVMLTFAMSQMSFQTLFLAKLRYLYY